jgi:hydroxyacylglutathione hydrolase
MLLEVFSSGLAETNTYLLGCPKTKRAVIIDFPQGSLHWLEKQVKAGSLSVQTLLLTHSHWDHIADAAKAKRAFGAPLYVHEEDAQNVESPGSDGLPLFFPIEGVKPDGYLKEGQLLEVGTLTLEVIHTPGHTPGGVCFYLREQGILFSGDTLFLGTMGRVDFPLSNPKHMGASLKKLAALPKETLVYPGHADPTTIGNEAWITQAEKRWG